MLWTIPETANNANLLPRNPFMTHLRQYLLLLTFMLLALTAQAQPRVEVLKLQHRQAEEIVDQLMALYPGPDTVFSPDGQRLVVKSEAPQMAEIRDLVNRLDVAPAQMRITLRRQQQDRESTQSPGTRTYSTANAASEQSIVMLDGETARIEAGSIRRVTRVAAGGDTVALIAEDTPMTEGFLVQPRALGSSQVELRVVAFDNSSAGHGDDRSAGALVTLRRAAPGEWVALGSNTEESASERGQTAYSTARASSENQYWSIKVDILQ